MGMGSICLRMGVSLLCVNAIGDEPITWELHNKIDNSRIFSENLVAGFPDKNLSNQNIPRLA
jgi:hypothetical protein